MEPVISETPPGLDQGSFEEKGSSKSERPSSVVAVCSSTVQNEMRAVVGRHNHRRYTKNSQF